MADHRKLTTEEKEEEDEEEEEAEKKKKNDVEMLFSLLLRLILAFSLTRVIFIHITNFITHIPKH